MNRLQRQDVVASLNSLKKHLSTTHFERLVKLAALIDDEGTINLSRAIEALFPGAEPDSAQASLRKLRMMLLPHQAKVNLKLRGDLDKKSPVEKRQLWFEGDEAQRLEVERRVFATVNDVDRRPQDAIPMDPPKPRPVRLFVSYAHADEKLRADLMGRLLPLLEANDQFDVKEWSDHQIGAGEEWRDTIRTEIEACDLGLLLLTEHFLNSRFIAQEELPYFVATDKTGSRKLKPFVPVCMKKVLGQQFNLRGIEEKQMFRDQKQRAFRDVTGNAQKDEFARDLYHQILKKLGKGGGDPAPKTGEPVIAAPTEEVDAFDERQLRDAMKEHVAGKLPPYRAENPAAGISLDNRKAADSAPDNGVRKDALIYLNDWLRAKDGTRYCALLGEAGMGKTTTARKLAFDLLEDESSVMPIYLDLKAVGAAAKGMKLKEILDRTINHFWRAGLSAPVSAERVYEFISGGALVIWDGLDEVLVHLTPTEGQQFTQELMRVLEPEVSNKGRMIITCRTEYFPTLRAQKAHFVMQGREKLKADDYEAFLLLPFDEAQIKDYIAHSLPNENLDRVMETIDSIHNLKELAARPMTLAMIADQFSKLEVLKAAGETVTGVTLYEEMVKEWLERDDGKHTLLVAHKRLFMEHLAAELWKSGKRSWQVHDLEQWLVDFLAVQSHFERHYKDKVLEVMKEDLRTATFLSREGEDQFRFAHTSLQEFFLASHFARALQEGAVERLAVPRASRETLDFLGQLLQGLKDDIERVYETMRAIRGKYLALASEQLFEYLLLAHEKGLPRVSMAGFQLPGIDLVERRIGGLEGEPLNLTGINLAGARLRRSRWQKCHLDGAVLDGCVAANAEFEQCRLEGSSWRDADLAGASFHGSRYTDDGFSGAKLYRTRAVLAGLGRPEVLVGDAADWLRKENPNGHTSAVRGCAISADGRTVVSASYDKTLRVWDAASGDCLRVLHGHTSDVQGCAISADGRTVVSASYDKTLRVWDAASGDCLRVLHGHTRDVQGCAISADGRTVVSASDDQTVRLWDAASGDCLRVLKGHTSDVQGCAISADGRTVVSASSDQTVRLWDAASGDCLRVLNGHTSSVLGCAISADGRTVVSASSDKTLRVWDAASGDCLRVLHGHTRDVQGCAISADGRTVVSASYNQTVRLWDAASGDCLRVLNGHTSDVQGCAISADGRTVVSASSDQTVRLWDAASGDCLRVLNGHTSYVLGCAISADGRTVVSASSDKTVRLWDAASGDCLRVLNGHTSYVLGCAISADRRTVVSASYDQTVRLWDAASGDCLRVLHGHTRGVRGCAISADGRTVVSASYDKTLRLWDAASGDCLRVLHGHTRDVFGCAISADGRTVVSASSDQTVRLWDAASGDCLRVLNGHTSSVQGCAISADGKTVVSASSDKTVRLWDAASGDCLRVLHGPTSDVFGCAISADGRTVVSASSDQTVRLWDAASGDCLRVLHGHTRGVRGCAISADGTGADRWAVVSASYDGSVRRWNLESGEEIGPRILHFEAGAWALIDPKTLKVIQRSENAWRYLNWICQHKKTGELETFPEEMLLER